MPVNYWVVMNALDYKQPELMVIDCFSVSSEYKTALEYNNMHQSLDTFPLTRTKYEALQDLWTENSMVTDEQKWDFIWDFTVYHERWEELEKEDFIQKSTVEKGAEYKISVYQDSDIEKYSDEKMELPKDAQGVIYLRKLIEECQGRGIKVLLIYIPFPADENTHMEANFVEDIAEDYHIDYVNFLDMDVVDYKTDCCDATHLNVSGARKITSYLGKYIKEHYKIEDKRKVYQSWENDYKLYTNYKISNLQEQTSLENYLMLCRDKNFSLCLSVKEDSELYQNEMLMDLIRNLSAEKDLPELQDSIYYRKEYALILDNKRNVTWEWTGDKTGEANTSFGDVRYGMDESCGRRSFWIEGKGNMISFDTEEKIIPDLQIAVIDNLTCEIVDSACFFAGKSAER